MAINLPRTVTGTITPGEDGSFTGNFNVTNNEGSSTLLTEDLMHKRTEKFTERLTELNSNLDKSIDDLSKNATDPALLAKYQTAASAYNVYRQMVSSSIKDLKDQDLAIIRNF